MAITGWHICCIVQKFNTASCNAVNASYGAKGLKPYSTDCYMHVAFNKLLPSVTEICTSCVKSDSLYGSEDA